MSAPATQTPETAESPYSHDVLWIFDPEGKHDSFAYTVGLGVRTGRAYELACTGLPATLACQVLNNAAAQLVEDDTDPEDGTVLDGVLDGYTVRLRPVDDTSDFHQMRAHLGEQPPVWQVLWPDADGRFPGEPGFLHDLAQRHM
ncbi:DUF4262 domain-containing protein [Streptomyces sp. NPDC057620]|uniref:DUF4262 domain-containing protein n=1 Tax=Streptomyces sp. NPDC057620 TaxID=3346185 RepID=UPI0036B8974A